MNAPVLAPRLAALATAGLILALAPVVTAAPREVSPQLTDPVGDASLDRADLDLASVTYQVVGRRTLVVTMKVDGAVTRDAGYMYRTWAQVVGCGHLEFLYETGSVALLGTSSVYLYCTDGTGGTIEGATVSVTDSAIQWAAPLSALPPKALGATVRDFYAATEPQVPYFNIGTAATSVDTAAAGGSWRLA